jgi:Trypsin/Regulatory CLIP domain of proteinases
LYAQDKSRNTIMMLQQAQRNCGNRILGRDPILCCRDQTSDCNDPLGTPGVCKSIRQCPVILAEFSARQSDPAFTSYIQKSNANCKYVKPNVCCTSTAPVIPATAPATPPPTAAPTQAPTQAPTEAPRPTVYDGSARLITPDEGCGFSNVTHNKVVGGVPAVKAGWPWMVLLGYRDSLGEVSFKCGASMITNRHVLTAAHCLRSNL